MNHRDPASRHLKNSAGCVVGSVGQSEILGPGHHGAHKLKADQPGTSRCGHQLRANRYPNRLLPEDHAPRDDAEKSDDLPRRLGVDQRRKVIVQPGIPEKQLLEVGGQLAAPGPLTESKDALPE